MYMHMYSVYLSTISSPAMLVRTCSRSSSGGGGGCRGAGRLALSLYLLLNLGQQACSECSYSVLIRSARHVERQRTVLALAAAKKSVEPPPRTWSKWLSAEIIATSIFIGLTSSLKRPKEPLSKSSQRFSKSSARFSKSSLRCSISAIQ